MDPLQETLAGLEHDGRLDSSGHFTIDPHQAARKYQQFLNAEPALPLLKMIQAGVALEASEIRVSLLRTGWSVECKLGSLGDAAVEALRGSVNPARRGAEHLQVGWQMALAGGGAQVTLEAVGRASRIRWTSSHGAFEPDDSPFGSAQSTVTLSEEGGWQGIFTHLRRRAGLLATLANRCSLCPVQIVLDGDFINPVWPPPPAPPAYPLRPSKRDFTDGVNIVRSFFSIVERWWLEPEPRSPRFAVPSPGRCGCMRLTTPPDEARLDDSVQFHSASIQVGPEASLPRHQARLVDPDGRERLPRDEANGLIEEPWPIEPGRARELLRFGTIDVVPTLLMRSYESLGQAPPSQALETDLWLELPKGAHHRIGPSIVTTKPVLGGAPYDIPDRSSPLGGVYLTQLLTVPSEPDGRSYLYAVMDGVLSDPLPVELGKPGMVAYVAATDLQTDLSQLKLVDDAAVSALLTRFDEPCLEELRVEALRWVQSRNADILNLAEHTRQNLRKRLAPQSGG